MFMRTFGYASGHPDSVAYVWLQVVLSFMGSLYSILTPPPSSLPPYSFPPPSTHFLSSFLSPSSPSSPSSSSSSFCSFNHIYTTQSILNGVGPHLLCSNRWDFGHSVPLSDSGSSIHVTYLQRCRSSVSNPSQEIETFFFQNKFFFLFKIFSWLLSRLKPASENLPKNDNNNKLHLKFLRSRFSICLFAHLAVVVCELGFCGCLLMRWFRCLLMSMCLCLFVCLFVCCLARAGRHSDLRRDHRGDADSGEVVPGSFRLLVQLAPHNACAGAGGRRAHAQRCQTGHDLVDQSTVPVHFIPPRQPQPQRIITSQ